MTRTEAEKIGIGTLISINEEGMEAIDYKVAVDRIYSSMIEDIIALKTTKLDDDSMVNITNVLNIFKKTE